MTMSTYTADPVLDATADYLFEATSAITQLTADITSGAVVVTPRNVEGIRWTLTTMVAETSALVTAITDGLAAQSGQN